MQPFAVTQYISWEGFSSAVGGKNAAVVGNLKAGFAGALAGQAPHVSISIQRKIKGNAGAGAGLAVL